MTPQQRRLRARLGGLQTLANGTVNTKASHDAFLKRFEDQVDAGRVLPPEERARRALAARKAYMGRLALRSSMARSKKKTAPAVEKPRAVAEARHGVAEQPTAA